uniref:WGS project CBMI000000000 data, contig CS3069_c002478 n=1 Tax=Fusarium clavum TaxID=2594811 RepID=A0A090MH08_9HYPO|nr:unnamed protein product [Fusarium clavum]
MDTSVLALRQRYIYKVRVIRASACFAFYTDGMHAAANGPLPFHTSSLRLEVCDTPAPTPEEVHVFFKQLSEDSRKAYGTRAFLMPAFTRTAFKRGFHPATSEKQ